MIFKTKGLALTTTFGIIIFLSKTIIVSPFDKILIFVQALFLALGTLLLGIGGATYVSFVGGILTVTVRPAMAIFTFIFALFYGILVDAAFAFFKVKSSMQVNTVKAVYATTFGTALTGLLSYYTTAIWLGLLPRNFIMEAIILVAGIINGAFAGYFAAKIWNKYLKFMEQNLEPHV
ncbi:MAG: hypothetical protein QXU21_06180 [Candidatus Bathyarchaeia archaeon]